MNRLFTAGLLSLIAAVPLAAQVPGVPGPPKIGITLGAKVSTLGGGLEVGKSFLPRIGARLGLNYAKVGTDLTIDNISYGLDLKLTSVPVLLDLYLLGPFRASAGLVYHTNQLALSLDPTTAITIGNQSFSAADIGTISGSIGFARKFAPYLGLGIGGRGKIGFVMEFGAMFPGDIAVTYTGTTNPSAPPAVATQFQQQVQVERTQIESDINGRSWVKVWPVFGIGLQISL